MDLTLLILLQLEAYLDNVNLDMNVKTSTHTVNTFNNSICHGKTNNL